MGNRAFFIGKSDLCAQIIIVLSHQIAVAEVQADKIYVRKVLVITTGDTLIAVTDSTQVTEIGVNIRTELIFPFFTDSNADFVLYVTLDFIGYLSELVFVGQKSVVLIHYFYQQCSIFFIDIPEIGCIFFSEKLSLCLFLQDPVTFIVQALGMFRKFPAGQGHVNLTEQVVIDVDSAVDLVNPIQKQVCSIYLAFLFAFNAEAQEVLLQVIIKILQHSVIISEVGFYRIDHI